MTLVSMSKKKDTKKRNAVITAISFVVLIFLMIIDPSEPAETVEKEENNKQEEQEKQEKEDEKQAEKDKKEEEEEKEQEAKEKEEADKKAKQEKKKEEQAKVDKKAEKDNEASKEKKKKKPKKEEPTPDEVIKQKITELVEDESGVKINKIDVVENHSDDANGGYNALIHLVFDVKNRAKTAKGAIDANTDRIGSKLAGTEKLENVTFFWEVPYLLEDNNIVKINAEQEDGNMYRIDEWYDGRIFD